jgi:hypothetical protein
MREMTWLVLLLASAAPSPDDLARAKVHFQAGKTHYDLGNYSEAIREFAAGYALAPRPDFLINLGQAYRAAGDRRTALDMFERYLEKAPPNAPLRRQVQGLISDLRAELAKETPPEPAAPAEPPRKSEEPAAATSAPATAPATASAPAETTSAAPAAAVQATPPEAVTEEPRRVSPLVWALPVGAAVVLGLAVGLGVGLSQHPVSCSGAGGLGCVDLRQR